MYWLLASALSAVCGVVWAYIIQPGVGINLAEKAEAFSTDNVDLVQTLVNWIPDNAAAAFGNFNIIQVIIFSLFLGIAIAVLPNDLSAKDGLQKFFDYGNTAITKVVENFCGSA